MMHGMRVVVEFNIILLGRRICVSKYLMPTLREVERFFRGWGQKRSFKIEN
jgi:hypothetical protein